MTIALYAWDTPNGRKISVALEEMGLPYGVTAVDITLQEKHLRLLQALCGQAARHSRRWCRTLIQPLQEILVPFLQTRFQLSHGDTLRQRVEARDSAPRTQGQTAPCAQAPRTGVACRRT